MKKTTLLIIVALLCVLLVSCKKETPPENTLHTMPPTENSSLEPEWAQIDCDIALLDSNLEVVLLMDSFDTFALVEDNESYIIVRVTDDAKKQLCSATTINDYSITLENEVIADVTVDPDTFNGEFIIGKGMPTEDVYILCDRFRNFY